MLVLGIAALVVVGLSVRALMGGSSPLPRGGASVGARAPEQAQPKPQPPVERPDAIARLSARGVAVTTGTRRDRMIALTFDDGPGPYTPAVLSRLKHLRAHATFFLVGTMCRYYPHTLRRMVRDGHAIGDHTWSHPNLARLPKGQVVAQIERTAATVQQATGVRPRLLRPPYGGLNAKVLRVARGAGMLTVLWSVETRDWRRPGPAAIARAALAGARPGAIILLHDGGGTRDQTVQALPAIVRGLRARRYRLVTVPELLAAAPPPPRSLTRMGLSGD